MRAVAATVVGREPSRSAWVSSASHSSNGGGGPGGGGGIGRSVSPWASTASGRDPSESSVPSTSSSALVRFDGSAGLDRILRWSERTRWSLARVQAT